MIVKLLRAFRGTFGVYCIIEGKMSANEHCWRNKEELISYTILLNPSQVNISYHGPRFITLGDLEVDEDISGYLQSKQRTKMEVQRALLVK